MKLRLHVGKIIKKKKYCGAITVFILLIFGFEEVAVAQQNSYNLCIALAHNSRSSWVKACDRFEKEIEKKSNGQLAVEIYHSGQLGSTRQVLELVYLDAIEAAVTGTAQVEAYAKEMGVIVLPFIWHDEPSMFAALDGKLGEVLENELNQHNFHALAWFANGFRCVTNSRGPVQSVEDMAGLKIRVIPSPAVMTFFEAIDAFPVHIDWVELYEALKMGVVDAQENPPFFVYLGRLYEVQKYYSLTEHMNEPGVIILNKRFYDQLPKDLQLLLDETAQKAAQWQRAEMHKDNKEMLELIKASGKTQVNTISDETRAAFRRIAQERAYPQIIRRNLCGPHTEELIRLAQSFKENR